MAVRTNELRNFKGERYITEPEMVETIRTMVQAAGLCVKPYEFAASALESDGDGGMTIVVPSIVFTVYNKDTGLVYGDIAYLSGDDSGKTRITFADWNAADFGSASFVALGFTDSAGEPVRMLETGIIE